MQVLHENALSAHMSGFIHVQRLCQIAIPDKGVGSLSAAVVKGSHLTLSELNSSWRWWHSSVSVTTQPALVFHTAQRIDSPQSCSTLADSQSASIGTNKSIFMHFYKVD